MRTIAENILGETDDPEPSLQLDALGEVANVICGNVLPEVDDPRPLTGCRPAGADAPPTPGGVGRVGWHRGWRGRGGVATGPVQ
jgi:hypothetical protein